MSLLPSDASSFATHPARHFGARALAVGTGRLYSPDDILACNPDAFLPDLSNLELLLQTLDEF